MGCWGGRGGVREHFSQKSLYTSFPLSTLGQKWGEVVLFPLNKICRFVHESRAGIKKTNNPSNIFWPSVHLEVVFLNLISDLMAQQAKKPHPTSKHQTKKLRPEQKGRKR